MNIELIPLLHEDKDITDLMRIHASPSVAKHIHISENFFDYAIPVCRDYYLSAFQAMGRGRGF